MRADRDRISSPARGRRKARQGSGRTGWVCTRRPPSAPTRGARGPDYRTAQCVLAPGHSRSPGKGREGKGRRGGAAVGWDQARAGSPSSVRAQPPAPRTHPLRPPPAPSPRGPERAREEDSGRAGSGPRGRGAGGAGGSAHLAVRVPERPAAASPRPRVLPGAGQPRARRMDGRRLRPAPALHGLPLRPGSASGCAGGQRLGRARKAVARSLRPGEPGSALPRSLLPPPPAASRCHLEPLLPPPGGRLGKERPPPPPPNLPP
ncbi:proline-rich proteoglycan 2-like [Neofelis nebulosa]|uniref:proline-rich proteoglycan 2-like n=1 Tax=Neofelis nebulosa TaxID=61452 RepID=UPI00272B885D|nr:proline-rich proteoglycan 2-like [Neofelis nebulosa]